jgi:hypothetical protein
MNDVLNVTAPTISTLPSLGRIGSAFLVQEPIQGSSEHFNWKNLPVLAFAQEER